MTLIRRTNPLGELVSLRQTLNRLSAKSFSHPRVGPAGQESRGSLVAQPVLPSEQPGEHQAPDK